MKIFPFLFLGNLKMVEVAMKIKIHPDLQDLIPDYLTEMEIILQKFRGWLQSENFIEIAREGHKCKGHGGAYGFDFISILGEKIQDAGKAEDKTSLENLIAELEREFHSVEIEYSE